MQKLQRAIQIKTTDGNVLLNVHPHPQNILPTAQIAIKYSREHNPLTEQPNFVRVLQNILTQSRHLGEIQIKFGLGNKMLLVKMMPFHVFTINREPSPESKVHTQPLLQIKRTIA